MLHYLRFLHLWPSELKDSSIGNRGEGDHVKLSLAPPLSRLASPLACSNSKRSSIANSHLGILVFCQHHYLVIFSNGPFPTTYKIQNQTSPPYSYAYLEIPSTTCGPLFTLPAYPELPSTTCGVLCSPLPGNSLIIGACATCAFPFLRRSKNTAAIAIKMNAKTPTPTPIPAFVPPVNPPFSTLMFVGVPELVEVLCEVAAVDAAVVEEVVDEVVEAAKL